MLDRQKQTTGAVLSNAIKQKRKEKAVSLSSSLCGWYSIIFRENIMFHYLKLKQSVTLKLSKLSKLENQGEKDGSEWSLKQLLWAKTLPENLLNLKDSLDQWVFATKK